MATKKKAEASVPAVTGDNAPDLKKYVFLGSDAVDIIRENLGNQPLTPADFVRIKFPTGGNIFWSIPTLEGKAKPVDVIEGIILMHRDIRLYWKEDYTGAKTPPDCFSDDTITGHGDPGGVCELCPFNEFGSTRKGTKAKACKQMKLLFLMKPGNSLPIIVPVPPTSLKPVKEFMLQLAMEGFKYRHVVLSIGLESAKNEGGIEYGRIVPVKLASLPDEACAQIDAYVRQFEGLFAKVRAQDLTKEDVE